MSRGYLFTGTGEQVDSAGSFEQLMIPQRGVYIVAVRKPQGYRVVRLPELPRGDMCDQLQNLRISWSIFYGKPGEFTLPTITAVRAYLQLGGELP